MRVLLVCPYSWTRPGGVQVHVAGLARSLRELGMETTIFAPADRPVTSPGFVSAGRPTPVFDNGSTVPVALMPTAVARARRIASSPEFDVIHVHEPAIPAVSLGVVLAARAPLVGTFHRYATRPGWYRPFGPLCRRALARLDARIAVSNAARHHVERACPGRYRVIPNGVDVEPSSREGESSGGGDGASAPRILFLGRADPRKGLPVLLDAFARLPVSATLDVAGAAPSAVARLRAGLDPGVARRVRAHGVVGEAAKRDLLARADVLCAPALEGESFGIVLVEAMAAGTPVVASAVGGYPEVVRPGWGRLVPPGDPVALADALRELLADEARRCRMGEAGRRAAERYRWRSVAAEVAAVYEDVLAGRAVAAPAAEPPRRAPSAAADRAAESATSSSFEPTRTTAPVE